MNDTLLVVLLFISIALALFILGTLSLLMLPIFLLIVFAAALYEFVGINHMRRRFGRLQFPVITLRDTKTGHRVRLVGVIHIAEPAYWKRIQALIDRYGSSSILYEMISKPSDAEVLRFSENERTVFEFITRQKQLVGNVVQLLGLRYQKEGLSYPPDWIRTDMSGAELIRLLAENDAAYPEEAKKHYQHIEDMAKEKGALKWVLHKGIGHIALLSTVTSKMKRSPYRTRENEIIISMRNAIAVEAILRRIETSDVVAIWGVGHLTGMTSLLNQAGFTEEKKEWLTAWTPPKFGFIEALRFDTKDDAA